MTDFLFDPYNATDIERDQNDLELFLLFCIFVAGKKATMIAKKLQELMIVSNKPGTPLEKLYALWKEDKLIDALKDVKMGKYSIFTKTFDYMFNHPMDLKTCSVQDLEKIPGISHKTSRFFLLHSRKNVNVAVIDTHMLKCLKDLGYENIPNTIPKNKEYYHIEKIILNICQKRNLSPQDFDLSVWTWYSKGNKGIPDFLK